MSRIEAFFLTVPWESLGMSLMVMIAALLAGVAICRILFDLLLGLARRTGTGVLLIERLRSPARLLVPLLALMLVAPSLAFPTATLSVLQQIFSLCFIAAMAWLFINTILATRDIIFSRYHADTDLKARAIQTQVTIIVKVIVIVVIIIAVATMLMTFEKIRQVGVSILASAGIIGVIAGIAAQRSIATLFAGLQIALTQPIRINDAVIVEGEYGKIEEITLTYVVVKTWDLRRLIVPVTFFLEKSFQNWSRVSPELFGTVFVYADYSVPVSVLRNKLHEILQESDKLGQAGVGLACYQRHRARPGAASHGERR